MIRATTHPSQSFPPSRRIAIARDTPTAQSEHSKPTEPTVVLADEPTGNLDSDCSAGVMSLLSELNSKTGVTAMVITHDDRWQDVVAEVSALSKIDARGFAVDDDYFRLGNALMQLEEWDDALEAFGKIDSALPSPREEARRYLNHAYALHYLRRRDEACELISSNYLPSWPDEERAAADEYLAQNCASAISEGWRSGPTLPSN